MRIEGSVAVITGAAGGIGNAVAVELARRGAGGLALVDLNPALEQTEKEINSKAGREIAVGYLGDTTDEAFRRKVFADTEERMGVPRICVPAAGITKDSLAVRIDKETGEPIFYPRESFRMVMEINLVAPVYWAMELVGAVAKLRHKMGAKRWHHREGSQGSVVFLGSVASTGNIGQISYSSAKAGLEGAASTLMAEAIYHGIRCSIIHPGFTNTPMVRKLGEDYINGKILPQTLLKRLLKPEEIADAICFLITNLAVSGELWADAGWRPAIP